ncbi:MAG TPA: adenosine deaminase [Gemmatimonadaceae bacterium]|nr:adenosine deaminase [Gemmatimonadaceae bacterium]
MPHPIGHDLLRRLPKAELHCHLDGSIRPSTLLELGREHGVPMPVDDTVGLAEYMVVRDARHLEDYLARFDVTLSVLQTADALERASFELAEDSADDGVRYLEVRYSPVLNVRHGLTLGEAVEAPLRGLERARREYGIIGRVIICALRNLPPGMSLELAKLAVSYRDRGVVGFDLAGPEAAHPASEHAEAFAWAHAHDLACTCHAGEGAGAESLREAIHDCGAHRLGHGTRLIEDASLMRYVNDHRLPLEICLTSNVQTRAVASYAAHPLRRYFDAGLPLALCTDNRLMSGTTLSNEYAMAALHLGFTFDELCDIALASFESCFLPVQERDALVASVRRDIGDLIAEQAA